MRLDSETKVSIQQQASDTAPVVTFDSQILTGQLAPSSIAMYERDFRAYLAFAGTFEAALLPASLARWRTHLAQATDKSPNTINRMLSAVKRLMREAAAQGFLAQEQSVAFDHVPGVKVAALKNRIKDNARVRIEPEDMRLLCELPDRSTLLGVRDAALLATLATGALRVSELITLTPGQIRRKAGGFVLMIVGKNDVEPREAPLGRKAQMLIEAWLSARPVESAYIFTAFDGRGQRISARPMSAVAVWKIVRKYSLLAGLPEIKPHDFRRFVGTQLARKDIRKAQKALGHKRLETTARHYVLDELEAGLTDDLY